MRCVACAVSWATWLLFTDVLALCFLLLRGVLGHLAPVHRCARSVRCVASAVSWATWLLFTGVIPWSIVLCVQCPVPLGSCPPECPLGALCCVCGVLGHLAPVRRCVCAMSCVWSAQACVCGCVSARLGVAAGCALVHPHGGCFVAGRGWACCRARTLPSGRRLFRSRQGLGPLLGVHSPFGWRLLGCWLWSVWAGRPPGRVLVRRIFPVAVLLFFRPLPVRLCPWCVYVRPLPPPAAFFSSAQAWRLSFGFFRPWVPWASALCGCPPVFPPFYFPPPFSLLSGCFRPLVPCASALCGCLPPFFVSFPFFVPLSGGSCPLVPLALAPPGWVSFSSFACGQFCGARVVRWCCAPPPPWRLLLMFCGVPRPAVWCRGLVWAVLCGSRVFWHFSVPCCAGVRVLVCLVCCRVVLWVLSLAISRWRWLRLAVFSVLCPAVLCGVSSCTVVCCVVFFGAVRCRGALCRPVRCVLLHCVGCVWLSCPVHPPLLLPFLLPGRLSWPVVVRYPGVRCCVVLLCPVSCVVLLSVWFLAVWCFVASFALAGAVCCSLCFLGVLCWVWLSAIVFGRRALSLVCLSGHVPCCPVVCCCLSWYPAPLCCVRWCCVSVCCCAVVPCCAFCFPGGVCLFPFPVCAVLCWRECVMLFDAGLVCAFSGVSCGGVLLCAVLFPLAFCGALVVPCGVVWCVVVFCCAVLCPVVLCCLVVPRCRAVLCFFRCCLWLFCIFPFKTTAACLDL